MADVLDCETGTERAMLEAHLDEARATAVRKVSGLPWEMATRRLGPTPTSAAGIVKHLTEVERWWFRHYFAGEAAVPFWSNAADPDGEYDLTGDESIEAVVARYEEACRESRSIAARHGLDDRCARARRDGTRPSLRWLYVHLIDEVARHNGQLDIYRELLDGTTDRDLD